MNVILIVLLFCIVNASAKKIIEVDTENENENKVCGSDGYVYDNDCEFAKAASDDLSLERRNMEVCKNGNFSIKRKLQWRILKICGSDGKFYRFYHDFEVAKHCQGVKKMHNGMCNICTTKNICGFQMHKRAQKIASKLKYVKSQPSSERQNKYLTFMLQKVRHHRDSLLKKLEHARSNMKENGQEQKKKNFFGGIMKSLIGIANKLKKTFPKFKKFDFSKLEEKVKVSGQRIEELANCMQQIKICKENVKKNQEIDD